MLIIDCVQGTLPYMSVNLLKPSSPDPVIHRLSHDLESLCMILIHIVRFSYGPIGTINGTPNEQTNRISQWHHESDIETLEDNKKMDLKAIAENPERYINGYWAPIVPYIQKLLYLVYPSIATNNMDSTALMHQEFKNVLISARDYCCKIPDFSYNYAAFNVSGSIGRKRPREDPAIQSVNRNTRRHFLSFSESQLEE